MRSRTIIKATSYMHSTSTTIKVAHYPMSALDQKQTSAHVRVMSALPLKADIGTEPRDVRFVPKADIRAAVKPPYSITSSASDIRLS